MLKDYFIQVIDQKEGVKTRKSVYIFNFLLLFTIIGFLFYIMFTTISYDFYWESIYEYRQKFIDGFLVTIYISFFALILSLIFGVLFAYGQNSKFILLRFFSRFYIEIIRGTPLLVQILIFFYVFANNLGFDNRYIIGTVILSMFASAYVSEIIRAGVKSIDKGQYESAKSLGFTPTQSYMYIIFPQAYKRILPPLTGQFASIIKDSSLLSIISISEFTMNAQEVNAYTYSTLESYIPLALGYLALTYPISYYASRLEKNMKD
ncbi:MAG TPA: amino acid ABC transporter permease [Sulfurospirillum arcachonense]|nr:amino acid ABC transporter permease [Sulfurospirillum arcachonense]HIP45629.1 amino acid ABC transporter permease [Sulfurospirillum arcachonense]